MADPAHKETDRLIAETEKRIRAEYEKAHKEIQAKTADYFKRFSAKDKTKRAQLKAGMITKAEYDQWRVGQTMIGKRWREMEKTLAADYHNANKIAMSVAKEHIPDAYAINHDYSTFQIEKQSRIDTSYTLYSREAAENLLRDPEQELLPAPRGRTARLLAENKDLRWNRQKINSAILQGILQGEAITKVATRLLAVTDMNCNAAMRNARTMYTSAQNRGRLDAMRRASSEYGLKTKKTWMATLDDRTRPSHRDLDGVSVDMDDEFPNHMEYPGDPKGAPEELYNCRCTMLTEYAGIEKNWRDIAYRYSDNLGDMSYDEWKKSKVVRSKKQLAPFKAAEVMRNRYLQEYRQPIK